MAANIASSIAGKLAEYTVDIVLRQIKYLFFFNSNIQNLRDKVKDLEDRKNDVKLEVDVAERNAQIIKEEVLAWLLKVDDLKEKANKVLNGATSSEMQCLYNRCPNLKSRYLLSRRATKKTIEADKLKVEGTFERVSYPRPPMQTLNLTHHKGFETRLSIKKKIKEALEDEDISIIGICGMPGVGKTTMAKEIVNEVKDEKLFEEVAFVVISNNPDIKKIQDQLADVLGLEIKEKADESVRAGRLRQRLEGNNKSILVVLDDVWEEIDLGTIGIPSPRDRKGLKIMFTTRIEETCGKMEAQRKLEIKVLDEKEGWQLFKDTSGISDDETDNELLSVAKKVAKECRGLPLALVVVGKALKSNKATYKWRDTLLQLQSRVTNLNIMENIVYKSIRLSYNYLESNEERDLLLLCSLFAEDESIPIENLVRYARGLELFQNTETLPQAQDRAKTVADKLKGCYLLQLGEGEDEVKLHDVIRDFCLKMATKDKCGYLVDHTGLKEWPEHDTDNSCSAISITFDKLDQLHSGLKHRNAKLLRVICRWLGECNIVEEFFEDMKELKVLELNLMNIQIPSSIQLLTGLRTLCLIECGIHSQLSIIGSLKKLEILSFYLSHFRDCFPIELANLSNLRSLDLRFQEISCPLRPGVLSGMKKLEELYLGDSIPIEGEDQKYIIEELYSLTSVHTFQISTLTPILMQLLKVPFLENLKKFQILVTTTPRGDFENQYLTRSLSLEDGIDASMLLEPAFTSLMKRTYHLRIEANKVLKNLVSELDGNNFINLKSLFLSRGDFEYLIDATNTIPNGNFGKLETLKLERLPKLIKIYNGNLPRVVLEQPLFYNLVTVDIHFCDAITSLFQESVAKCLVNLQRLDISSCPMLEEVVSMDVRENKVAKTSEMLEFPKLKEVHLNSLSRFKSFTSQSNSDVVSRALFNQVTLPNMHILAVVKLDCIVKLLGKETPITSLHKLRFLRVSICKELLTVAESDSIQLLQNLAGFYVSSCYALKVLLDFEGIKVTNDDAEINMLGRLTVLHLNFLPKLVHITRMVPKRICVFQNLTDLRVMYCKSLRFLFPTSIVNSLVTLESLSIQSCKALEEIIEREEKEENTSETTNIVIKPPSNVHHFRQVVSMDAKQDKFIDALEFPKLKKVNLIKLSSFKSFKSQPNNDGVLRTLFNQVTLLNMENLEIYGLQYIVKLVNSEAMQIRSLYKVRVVKVAYCNNLLTIARLDSSRSLQDLETLEVENCKALEVLFDFECDKVTKDHAESVLGRLRSLQLKYLDKLVHIIGIVPKGIRVFENLTSIVVERCGILKYLFSPSMAYSLVALNDLEVLDCGSIEEIIGNEEEGTSEIKIAEGMKTRIVFPNLNHLLLKNLSSIQMFCSQNCELVFPLLKDLTIENCPMMTKLSPWPISAPKLDISDLLDKAGGLAEENQVCNK